MTVLRAGLIGDHIGRSQFSAALAMMCEADGRRLDFELIDSSKLPVFDFCGRVDACRSEGWHGVSVTHPFKPAAAEYAAAFANPDIRKLGAVNTLIFRPENAAYNTDFLGFLDAWREVFKDRKPGRVALAGAGGVARAVGPALRQLGAAEITIWDPAPGRASDLAARIGPVARAVPADQSEAVIRNADGLVNNTPLGMLHQPRSAFDATLLGQQDWAFDAVYTPTDTIFLQDAARHGIAVLTGFDLFCSMALQSYRAYTGQFPDRERTLSALRALKPKE